MSNAVIYTVGNTYNKISSNRAKLDRSGQHKKVHDWTLFVDVLQGNQDLIHRVTFDLGSTFQPRAFACSCPVKVKRHDGQTAWRFSTRQQSYGSTQANISILGVGGSKAQASHQINLGNSANTVGPSNRFVETCPGKPLPLLKIDPNQKFGIELELTSPDSSTTVEQIASSLTKKTKGRFGRVVAIRNYSDAHTTTEVWKMVPDSSITCSRNSPSCTKFELVSPILTGGSGLNQASQVLDALKHTQLQVNKSMGFHVHVDVSSLSLQQVIKVCQNVIKYEDVIDALVPPSRRTGSAECDRFFQSNRQAMEQAGYATNKARNQALASCTSLEELAEMMNPNGRYHKINLENLITQRQPTIEFRQHSATSNPRKINSWVRFCITMVNNSARLKAPTAFSESRNLDFQFDSLFQFVVKDRALRNYYRGRREDLEGETDDCCQGCAAGAGCATHNPNTFLPGKARRVQGY